MEPENEKDEFQHEFDISPNSTVRVHCVAHRLQLAIIDFLYKKEQAVSNLVAKASRAVALLR